jgi:hypothetical protein
MVSKRPAGKTSDDDIAKYRHQRFSITLILNIEGALPEEYAPAMTVEVDAAKLFSENESVNMGYRVEIARIMGNAFHTLADKWRRQALFIVDDGDNKNGR